MKKFKQGLKIIGFVCLLVLGAFGAALGALPTNIRRREDPVKEKTELVERKQQEQRADLAPKEAKCGIAIVEHHFL